MEADSITGMINALSVTFKISGVEVDIAEIAGTVAFGFVVEVRG